MTTITYYLDTRAQKKDGTYPIKFYFFHRKQGAYINSHLSVLIEQWNPDSCKVVHHPFAPQYNLMLQQYNTQMELEVANLRANMTLNTFTAGELKRHLDLVVFGDPVVENKEKVEKKVTLLSRIEGYMASRKKQGTRVGYDTLIKRLRAYEPNLDTLPLEDVSREWILGLIQHLQDKGYAHNTVWITFTRLRAVINDALDDEVILRSPLRKVKLGQQETEKRSLSIENLRKILLSEVSEELQLAQDMFKLVFLLIGINTKDLYGLAPEFNKRVQYRRAKTGKLYDIKVEPEARALFKKYAGTDKALKMCEEMRLTSFSPYVYAAVQKLGKELLGPKTMLSLYWARHSWATIAAELEIPEETISAALGHSGGNRTTQVYIAFNQHKVDKANRRVIDYVFYNEGGPEE